MKTSCGRGRACTQRKLLRASLLGLCLLLAGPVQSAAESESRDHARCTAAIDRASGRHARCLFNAEAHFQIRGVQGSYENAVDRCEAKFAVRFERAHRRHGSENCPLPTSAHFEEAVSQLAEVISSVAASNDAFMLCPDGSGVRVSSSACVLASIGTPTWDSFTWYKQHTGALSFNDAFGGLSPGMVSADRLVLATTEAAAGLAAADVQGMQTTFGTSAATVEIFVRPLYTNVPTAVANGCDAANCDVQPVQAWISDMLSSFEATSGITPAGVACQQEAGWNPSNGKFRCPELMAALNGAYPFLQIEAGYECYKAPTGSPAEVHVVGADDDCTGPTVAGSCLCPTWHLLERTYEPYVIGPFKKLSNSARDCKSDRNANDYCCTWEDGVAGATCPPGPPPTPGGINAPASCLMTGEPAATSYGKLVGLFWNSDSSFKAPPGSNVPCLGIGYPGGAGNANCRVDAADGPDAAASLLQQITSASTGAPQSNDLCFY